MIIRPADKSAEFGRLRKGDLVRKGLSTGMKAFDGPTDQHGNFRLAKSYMSVWTGYPSSGKSEFVDAILMNMSILHNWHTVFYSPENHPIELHMAKLAEKLKGKYVMQFEKHEAQDSISYMQERFTWLYPEDPELDTLLNLTRKVASERPVDCLVIDPWNSVTHHRGQAMVHEYLQVALTKITRFARDLNTHIAVIAHPEIPLREKQADYPVPDLYAISDGAMWRNKCDYGFVVHRPDMSKDRVQVYLQKIKYKWMGKVGSRTFDYDKVSGRFKSPEETHFTIPERVDVPF